MTTILVVDDSAVDRRIVGGLLAKVTDWEVVFAVDGRDALGKMDGAPVDLVVTDLIMPEMDGLELVSEVKQRSPFVPVIIITSKGNEEIAVKALQTGAASYAPKNTLARSLVQTIQKILSVAGQQRDEARLIGCLTGSQYSFELENDSSLIPPLIGYLQEGATRIGLCDETERIRVGVALDEALVNALFHGNLEISSDLRDSDFEAYCKLVNTRKHLTPYGQRRIHVEATFTAEEGRFLICDEGPGFDPTSLPDPTDPANLEKLGGRGILLMRTFMDDVTFNTSGNEVTLVKKRINGAVT